MSSTYNKISEALSLKFKEIVGDDYFFSEFEVRWTYAFGGTIFKTEWIPDLILLPQTVGQVSQILKLANDNRIPVTPRGCVFSSGSLKFLGVISRIRNGRSN